MTLTYNYELGVGPYGFVQSYRPHLALVLSVVLEGRVTDPQVVDPMTPISQHRVSRKAGYDRRKT